MLLRNYISSLSNIIMKRFSTSGIANSSKNPRMIPNRYKNVIINLNLLSSLFDSSIEQYLDVMHINMLSKFFKPVNDCRNTCTFVIDETVAKDIVKQVSCKPKDVIVEGNPGLGLITINLIKAGVSHVYVLENSFLQCLSLLQIILEYTRRINRQDIIMDHNSFRSILLSLDKTAKHNSTIKFVGITTSFYFLRGLVHFFRVSYSRIKNFELYLVISSAVCQNLEIFTAKNLKYFHYCALNLFFNIQKLASYPRSAFLPPSRQNDEKMNLIKITVNSDFLKNFENSDVEEYFIFLTILGRRKSNFIISTLEKWLPDCGPYLISKGISMLNQVEDLSPQDSFILFKLFKKLEGYDDFKNCIFYIFQRNKCFE